MTAIGPRLKTLAGSTESSQRLGNSHDPLTGEPNGSFTVSARLSTRPWFWLVFIGVSYLITKRYYKVNRGFGIGRHQGSIFLPFVQERHGGLPLWPRKWQTDLAYRWDLPKAATHWLGLVAGLSQTRWFGCWNELEPFTGGSNVVELHGIQYATSVFVLETLVVLGFASWMPTGC